MLLQSISIGPVEISARASVAAIGVMVPKKKNNCYNSDRAGEIVENLRGQQFAKCPKDNARSNGPYKEKSPHDEPHGAQREASAPPLAGADGYNAAWCAISTASSDASCGGKPCRLRPPRRTINRLAM